MNNTTTQLTEAAWSKLEALSTIRRFIQNELEHASSLPPNIPNEKFERALNQIDGFSAVISQFLVSKNQGPYSQELEEKFEELSDRYTALMQELERIID